MHLLHQWSRCCLSNQMHQYFLLHLLNQWDLKLLVLRLNLYFPSDHLHQSLPLFLMDHFLPQRR